MTQMGQMLLLFCFTFSSSFSFLHAVVADPDPAPIQLLPFSSSSAPPDTIPAFPEQSNDAGGCPLDLSGDVLRGVSRACSAPGAGHGLPSPARCCPVLAASLLSAYSATALAAPRRIPADAYDMPVLPDSSEDCADAVEAALRARGAELPRVNGTCDAVFCYCGVRLKRLTCPSGAFVASGEEGRWVATEETARRLEQDCARPGLSGCTRCLRTLNQLKGEEVEGGNTTASSQRKTDGTHDNECQLMGLTWLLTRNRTLYLPPATAVLRALTAAPDGAPRTCSLTHDDMPLAVDSAQLDGYSASSTVALLPSPLSSLPLFLSVAFLF